MREIKFRVWDEIDRVMWFPKTIRSCYAPLESLMQYTGLLDKNGKEIYEGDVVKYNYPDFKETREIKWNNTSASFNFKFWYPVAGAVGRLECEIIGNIYENPELVDNNCTMSPDCPCDDCQKNNVIMDR